MISNFSDLIKTASDQEQPQRMLFLFAKTESRKSKKKSKQHINGTISPVMCVDKLPSDLSSFKNFVAEADEISKDWDFMIAAGLNGQNGRAPTAEEAEPHLNQMANNLMSGQDMSRYVIFDREENPIIVQSS